MKTLIDVPQGKSATVSALTCNGALKNRLMDMGVTKGTVITVRNAAPLGDPLNLILRGYSLAIRRADAKHIRVES